MINFIELRTKLAKNADGGWIKLVGTQKCPEVESFCDFDKIDYKINGVIYTEDSPEYRKAFEGALLFSQLKGDTFKKASFDDIKNNILGKPQRN